jgi:hypothetical protein
MAYSPSRFSSEYHTASSFDPQNEALNSTVALNDDTEGSADMSIEVGRGAKRTAREDALSEDGVFTFGSDQQYEMTGTPPLRTRDANVRKTDSTLRRDATVRKASEVAKANESVRRTTSLGGRRQPSLADALRTNEDHTVDDTMQGTVTLPARNTRFTRFQKPAANNGGRILSQGPVTLKTCTKEHDCTLYRIFPHPRHRRHDPAHWRHTRHAPIDKEELALHPFCKL